MEVRVALGVRSWCFFAAIFYLLYARLARAVGAAEENSVGFYTVADDFAAAVVTVGRHGLNSAFEAVEKPRFSVYGDLKSFIVIIAAGCTDRHREISFKHIVIVPESGAGRRAG